MSQGAVYKLEWDPAKALLNRRERGVTFDQAATRKARRERRSL
jgi:uncharacterized DUF497 family protein